MSYEADLNRHLAAYKRAQLGIVERGVFRYRGSDLFYDHILPVAQRYKNLLPEAESDGRAFFELNEGKRHRYFHHLNSSQAFAFNLFFPYFSSNSLTSSTLVRALGQGGELTTWELEGVPLASEGSNIDVQWGTTAGMWTYCEVKLSERSFGTADPDERHLRKLETIYRPRLAGRVAQTELEPSRFFQAYQFYRTIWHVLGNDQGRGMFLLPRANIRVWSHLADLLGLLPEATRGLCTAVAIEDVLEKLVVDSVGGNLEGYGSKLHQKYVARLC